MPTAMMPSGYNANRQILQTPDHVAIIVEMIHDVRIIPLDGRPHVSPRIRQWLGDSRGRWEGDTLVVETLHLVDRLDGGGVMPIRRPLDFYLGSGATLRIVERFTRVGPDTLDYEFTVDDPDTFTKPWTVALAMRGTSDRVYEYACHEGNHGLVGMLGGGRINEAGVFEEGAQELDRTVERLEEEAAKVTARASAAR
jgi:hypothetical protein